MYQKERLYLKPRGPAAPLKAPTNQGPTTNEVNQSGRGTRVQARLDPLTAIVTKNAFKVIISHSQFFHVE